MASGPASAHRTLASASRVAILHRLQAAGRPLRVDELAASVGLHVNTTRDHLDRLISAGFVTSEREHRATRGRPRVLYRSVARPAAATADPRHRDQLRRLLLDEYARKHGHSATEDHSGTHVWDQLAALETHFEDLGFDPDADVEQLQVHLRRCPVADLAREQTEMVCSVHLDLTRGVLARADGPLTAERLEPFVGPRHCILHLSEEPAGDGPEP
jgi:predicted ArsR family transcriptional regulator